MRVAAPRRSEAPWVPRGRGRVSPRHPVLAERRTGEPTHQEGFSNGDKCAKQNLGGRSRPAQLDVGRKARPTEQGRGSGEGIPVESSREGPEAGRPGRVPGAGGHPRGDVSRTDRLGLETEVVKWALRGRAASSDPILQKRTGVRGSALVSHLIGLSQVTPGLGISTSLRDHCSQHHSSGVLRQGRRPFPAGPLPLTLDKGAQPWRGLHPVAGRPLLPPGCCPGRAAPTAHLPRGSCWGPTWDFANRFTKLSIK